MRDPMAVLGSLPRTLRSVGGLNVRQSELLCTVEFGLFLQRTITQQAAAAEARVLFSGYAYAKAAGVPLTPEQERSLRVGRYTLWAYRRRSAWLEAVESYQEFDEELRGFDVTSVDRPAEQLPVFVVRERWDAYRLLMQKAPPFEGRDLPMAEPGRHWFPAGRTTVRITLPDSPRLPDPARHPLKQRPRGEGKPLAFDRCELRKTAVYMDRVDAEHGESRCWAKTLDDIDLSIADGPGFRTADGFTIDGIQHLLGIVGVGKSTLRDIVTIHVVKERKLRVTVVVGDVADALRLVERYNRYIDKAAAPIIGSSGRQEHAQRLHRRLAGRGRHSLLDHDDPGFAYLSTSCVLNVIGGDAQPLAFHEAPCTRLRPSGRLDERGFGGDGAEASDDARGATEWSSARRACPYWSACPRHRGARELVDADIWVTTPPALVSAPIPWPQNGERVRYLELACRRSDLVIIDEADRVQTQLDHMFAPATTLVGALGSRSFLDDLNQHKIREFTEGRRLQLSDRDVETWSAALNTVTIATDRLYAMLVADKDLRAWVRTGYFSAWTLHCTLLDELYPLAEGADGAQQAVDAESAGSDEAPSGAPVPSESVVREELERRLDAFRRNPFGDRAPRQGGDPAFTEMLAEVLHTSHQSSTRAYLAAQMIRAFALDSVLGRKQHEYEAAVAAQQRRAPKRRKEPLMPQEWFGQLVRKFEFSLLVAALEPKLVVVNGMWPRVASALSLGYSEMYRQPADYGPVVPEAPMGNVLGFQFKVHGPDNEPVRSGELRFFRCGGVGRELLRALPSWQTLDDMPGTNVLLMSGSSWAGASTRYHLAVPVGIVLRPRPNQIVSTTQRVRIRFEPVRTGRVALQVSGADMSQRSDILCRMAVHLATFGGDDSRLRTELLRLPQSRRRILLLVGSYDEAKAVADALHALSGWRNRVASLVSDNDDLDDYAHLSTGGTHHAPVLRRGEIEDLVTSGCDILVAPLLAVERGHNILNEENAAAIGTVYFLARPNPRPDDLGLAVQSVNDWVVRSLDDGGFERLLSSGETVSAGVDAFHHEARSTWYGLLARSLAWSRLGESRVPVTWDMLVLIWQVIGRLLRGGVDARVVFVDAAFLPNLASADEAADSNPDTEKTSLVHSMYQVLSPYFEPAGEDAEVSGRDRFIVEALYGPFWQGLRHFLFSTPEEADR